MVFLPHTWNSGMMESWNVGFQKKFFIYKDLDLPCQCELYQSELIFFVTFFRFDHKRFYYEILHEKYFHV